MYLFETYIINLTDNSFLVKKKGLYYVKDTRANVFIIIKIEKSSKPLNNIRFKTKELRDNVCTVIFHSHSIIQAL